MSRRSIVVGMLALGVAAGMAGLFALSTYVTAREPGWREAGLRLDSGTQLAVDISMWWDSYGWVVALAAVQILVTAGIWRGVRRAVVHGGQSGEARDFAEGPTGSERDGRSEPLLPPDSER